MEGAHMRAEHEADPGASPLDHLTADRDQQRLDPTPLQRARRGLAENGFKRFPMLAVHDCILADLASMCNHYQQSFTTRCHSPLPPSRSSVHSSWHYLDAVQILLGDQLVLRLGDGAHDCRRLITTYVIALAIPAEFTRGGEHQGGFFTPRRVPLFLKLRLSHRVQNSTQKKNSNTIHLAPDLQHH